MQFFSNNFWFLFCSCIAFSPWKWFLLCSTSTTWDSHWLLSSLVWISLDSVPWIPFGQANPSHTQISEELLKKLMPVFSCIALFPWKWFLLCIKASVIRNFRTLLLRRTHHEEEARTTKKHSPSDLDSRSSMDSRIHCPLPRWNQLKNEDRRAIKGEDQDSKAHGPSTWRLGVSWFLLSFSLFFLVVSSG